MSLTSPRETASLLGFEKKILKEVANSVGDKISNITRGVDWVFLHCDLSPDKQTTLKAVCCSAFQPQTYRSVIPFKKSLCALSGIR